MAEAAEMVGVIIGVVDDEPQLWAGHVELWRFE
jgi:hypothetical protein